MIKTIKNLKKITDFIKKYRKDIEIFKDSVVTMTPIFEDFKKLIGNLEF